MKVFCVCGIKGSGKTTTIEKLIAELCRRGYRVGSVKDIHFEGFAIDTPQSNTDRHRKAGAELVTARGLHETDLFFPKQLSMEKILDFYEGYDYVVIEGSAAVPAIVAAYNEDDLVQKFNGFTFCVSGHIAAGVTGFRGVPAISALTDAEKLADLVEQKVYDRLPDFSPDCCVACGMTCRQFGQAVLREEISRGRCVAEKGISLAVGGKRVSMVPFVQAVLKNAVLGVVSELKGYEPGKEIQIILGENDAL